MAAENQTSRVEALIPDLRLPQDFFVESWVVQDSPEPLRTSNRRIAEYAAQADASALQVLQSADTARLVEVVGAFRRVNRMLVGKRTPSDHFTETGGMSNVVENVLIDMQKFGGLSISREEVIQDFKVLVNLEGAFLKLATELADITWSSYPELVDKREMEAVASRVVERVVWFGWSPVFESVSEEVERLRNKVIANLNKMYLGEAKRPYNKRTVPIILKLEETVTHEVQSEALDENIWETWYRTVEGLSVRDIYRLLPKLTPMSQLAVLSKFGMIYSSLNPQETAKTLGISESTLNSHFATATKEMGVLRDLLGYIDLEPIESLDLGLVIDKAKKAVLSTSAATIRMDSSRFFLASNRNTEPFRSRLIPAHLTDSELLILNLSTGVNPNTGRLLTAQEIAEIVGLSEKSVSRKLKTIEQVARSGGVDARLINRRGEVIPEDSKQSSLIALKKRLTVLHLSNLGPLHHHFLDLLTTPDDQGRYSTIGEAARVAGISKPQTVIDTIIENTKDYGRISELLTQLSGALEGNLSDEEVRILAEHVLRSIQNGKPILSTNHNHQIAWVRLTAEVGLPTPVFKRLKRVLER